MSPIQAPLSEAEGRARVVEIARSYLRTPYIPAARIRRVGIDCATLLANVYEQAGLIPHLDLPFYPVQWNLHCTEERYLAFLEKYAVEVSGPPQPGDVVVWKMLRAFSHSAIVLDWPRVIHARNPTGCEYADADADRMLSSIGHNQPRPRKFFSFWAPRA